MKRSLLLLGLGGVALILQGVLAGFVGVGRCPDFVLLMVMGYGLGLPIVPGLLAATGLGYAQDWLAGALFGQHALLALGVFGLTRLANRQLDLRRPLPLVIFAALLTGLAGVAMLGLSTLFVPGIGLGPDFAERVWLRIGVNALVAWPVVSAVDRLATWLDPEEHGRRSIRIELSGFA